MTEDRSAAEVGLDDIVSEGVALDVFEADLARLLLEELDRFVEQINQTGTGKHFVANLQRILQRDLVLGLSRLYEPYSDRNPGRSLSAMVHHVETHATELRVWQRESLIDFLTARGRVTSDNRGLLGRAPLTEPCQLLRDACGPSRRYFWTAP